MPGLLVGEMAFGLPQPTIMSGLASVGALGRITLAELAGVSRWLVLLVFGQVVVLVLVLVSRVGATSRCSRHRTRRRTSAGQRAR